MVSIDTVFGGFILSDSNIRIESELDIQSYLQDLNYALDHGASISFQIDRVVDDNRDIRHS